MDVLRVDMRQIKNLDVVRLKKRAKAPPRKQFGSIQRPVVETAIDVAAKVSSTAKLLQELKDMAKTGSRVSLSILGGSGPMVKAPTKRGHFTMGVGAGSSVFASVGISAAAGIYGASTKEFGFFTSQGIGIWTDAGTSSELQITYIFGPPHLLGGMSWSIGIGADLGPGPTLSCNVIFGASGPPFELLGYTIGMGSGVSVLPGSVAFQVSSTQLIPK